MEFVSPPPMEPGGRVAVVAPSSGGASNALRVLRYLRPSVLREHPTRFYGMSDNTNLNLALYSEGVVSFNGAQLMNELAVPGELPAYTERYCRRAFFEDTIGQVEPAPEWSDEPSTWWNNPEEMGTPPEYHENLGREWRGGSAPASGRVWGGNRQIVEWHLAADRYLPDPAALEGAVLALETAEDLPSPTDVAGTLMSMGERGLLERFDAVLLGRVPGQSFVEEPSRDQQEQYRESVREAVVEQVARYSPGAPVVCGLDWGHTTPTVPLPVGGTVDVDPVARRISVEL
jgi:muramoyltetrapeptide carboxypeptidase LdcA involved in peptidoglycan recycling